MLLIILISIILFILWTMLKCAAIADENMYSYIIKEKDKNQLK